MGKTHINIRGSSWIRTRALIIKELHQIVRDPSSLLIAFGIPLIMLFLFGYGLSLDTYNIKVGVVLEDLSNEARSLAYAFSNTSYFDAHLGHNRNFFEDELVAGHIRGVIVIPQDFAEKLKKGDFSPKIQVISDGSEPNTASFVENYASGVFFTWLAANGYENAMKTSPPINIESRFWFNSELTSRNTLLPGCITLIMATIGTLLTALVVSREWERGTMEALMVTPVKIREIIISKLVPYFVLGMGSMLFSVAICMVVFEMPFRGSILALCIVSSVFLLTSLVSGLLISTTSKNQFVAAQAALISAFLPTTLLSGLIFDIDGMPAIIRAITMAIPARYFVPSLQTIFLAGDVWSVLLPATVFLTTMFIVLFILTIRASPKRLESA
ncbi:MAG: ABC transporter permease [Lentisphaerae bacterium]|nr:ABC transporter permease [Lentisphaerota bacterium]